MANREEILQKARSFLAEAVKLDKSGCKDAAIKAYVSGIYLLMELMHVTTDPEERLNFRNKIEHYISRAETLRFNSAKPERVELVTQYRIEENSKGHTYEKIFAECLDNQVTEVIVDDPYIIAHHQVMNLVMFCEMLIHKCSRLKVIKLATSPKTMVGALGELRDSLKNYGIKLIVETREFHDREIRFDNGWLVKIGRGLDIYKTHGKFAIGSHDFRLRPCKSTIVDIFKKNGLSVQ